MWGIHMLGQRVKRMLWVLEERELGQAVGSVG